MADEFETVELEISEDDIVCYLYDEDDNEIGFVVEEDGKEVEYFYEGYDADEYELIVEDEVVEVVDDASGGEPGSSLADLAELDGEVVEMEIDEEAIDHYLFDEQGTEIGFVIVEDGVEVECYYQEEDEAVEAPVDSSSAAVEPESAEPEEHGYLYKMAQIAGHEGNKARKKATTKLDKVRDRASTEVDKVRGAAEVGVDKATEAIESGGKRLKEKSDEYDLGITREGVAETTADLNAIAKEGAATAKELKEAYDDIMDSFGFLVPKGVRRKLP